MYTMLLSKNRPLNLRLTCKILERKMVFGPQFAGGIPQVSDMHFQIALTSEHVTDFR